MTLDMSIVVSLVIELNCVGHAVLPPLSINCVVFSAFLSCFWYAVWHIHLNNKAVNECLLHWFISYARNFRRWFPRSVW